MKDKAITKLVTAALLTALTCVATMVIRVPSLGPNGYVNIGDTIVLLCAWILGGWYGALAAGLGSCLADLLSGYAMYVPGTFLIKFLMALAAFALYKFMTNHSLPKYVNYLCTGIVAEIVMILGYLVYEYFFLGYGVAAIPAVLSNTFQGITNILIAIVVIFALNNAKVLTKLANR